MENLDIDIAIAEILGWTNVFQVDDMFGLLGMHPTQSMGRDYSDVPCYSEDLNAMHEAEKMLIENGYWYNYCGVLHHIHSTDGVDRTAFMHATARQRAEAFLRTFGKWVD